jgi:hypothetical protein
MTNSETKEQRRIVKLYRECGCEVVTFNQPRRSMQTPGIPDLRVYSRRKRIAWWHEVKTADGGLSDAQTTFAERARLCGEWYIWGGYDVAKSHLMSLGIIQ